MISSSFSPFFVALLLLLQLRRSDGAPAFASPPFKSGVSSTSGLQSLHKQTLSTSHRALSRSTRLHSSPGSGFGNKKPQTNKPATELFELQELRAQLQTILKQNILYQSLSTEKREELTKYVKAVVEKTESPIDFSGKSGSTMGTAQFVAGVEGKSWRMVFSTDGSSGGEGGADGLPYGSTVILRIGDFMGTNGKLDYVLKFSKQVMGLNELVAKSSCEVDIGPVNPGLFTFQYEDIKTNIFGVSNLPVGFFGLLKGRVNYVDTVWFDGERWIERNYLENGDLVYSVYVRDIDDEKENAKK
mmetsp:Transcript_28113/g.59354  ORF Transcript_28113/g.59354 Transcript_28113/m.59354 type:complete len:301 (-) Transcript_28113:1336-2238(-)|eukprot:CAMPEP_0183733498 /NCGR_PEP_ID=MMETSP0737-20130205/41370_1 /TAXON_ID=385413 /ORGANISM="Thalassiosira miniscula, Strain CCMP1093" /LENGTH=300 /DNA_ID=CAMNT_0025966767 /DNA_START=227 /DNA_END=1129 /DNA_ORIENTATION=-